MDFDYFDTNDDCKKCDLSSLVDVGVEYEEKHWICQKGYNLDFLVNKTKKPCGLEAGNYYKVEIKEAKRK